MKFSRIMMISLLIGTILIGFSAGPFASLLAKVIAQQTVPRNETLILSGYEGSPAALRPWDIPGSAGMAFYFMYEPLFGVDITKGSAPADLVKIVGESITWINSTTIEVKIRNAANWTDGTPITSEDVEYSYGVYGLFNSTQKPWIAQETLPLKERLQSWENVDSKTFRIHIKPAYPNSAVVWRHMTLSYNILPKHIWTQIEAHYGATHMREFANDWQDTSMNASWKVASGMYLPTYHTDTITIMTRNDNWWGEAVFGKLPAPKYIQHTRYFYSNAPAALDLQNNEIDICGNFIPGIGAIMSAFPQIHTYDPNPPYYPEKAIKLLVPNHHNYPIDAGWLHWAIAESLDYNAISAVSSGYLKTPYPYPSHLLPSDDAVATALVNSTLEQQYGIRNNLTAAMEILNQYCIKGPDNRWYTKNGPEREWIEKYITPEANLTIGSVTHPASVWNATYPASLDEADQLPGEPGVNVPLGPWTIMDQQGWSDVLAIDALACSEIRNLGITMTQKVVDWGTNDADGHAFNYDFMHFVMHTGSGTMYDRYYQMFVGTDYYWNHYGDYRNATLVAKLGQLDTTTGSAQQAIADDILKIIGTDMPIIPFGGHPDWYQYNTLYWTGFANKDTNPILPAGPFGGTSQSGVLQWIILGLISSSAIQYSDIAISKANVVPGESTTISAKAENTVNYAVAITAQLLINGSIAYTQPLSFAANETKTVSFNVSRTGIGIYLASLGGLNVTFIVAETPIVPAYIRGNVTDANTGNPISGATVRAGSYETTTATNGSYSLQVATGNYTLTVIKQGYATATATVVASTEGQTYTKDVDLTPVAAGEVIPTWVYAVIGVLVVVVIIVLVYAFVIKKK